MTNTISINAKEQGLNSSEVFHGKTSSSTVQSAYKESAPLFSEIIKSNISPDNYSLADLGSSKGEFLNDLISLLSEYTFETTAIDVNSGDLSLNNATHKICSNLSKLDLSDKSIDITIARYVLAWNNLETQKDIINEIKRTTKKIAIVQHQGACLLNPEDLQKASTELFSGVVPQLKRNEFFFSTSIQIETMMTELGINFEMIQSKDLENLSSIFIEKYKLSEEESNKVKEILKNTDKISISTWLLRF